MALVEGCKHSLEISVPLEEVERETSVAVADIQKRARLQGFRPGKAPVSIVRQQFAGQVRKQVLDALVPKFLTKQVKEEQLNLIGTPDITDVHFHEGEPLRFKAQFEVMPEIELADYKALTVPYQDPVVTDADIANRLEEIRKQKADYLNVDPRPLEDGDTAVISLESVEGVTGERIKQDEMMLEIAGPETLQGFTENLRGMSPEETKIFEVTYPENHGQARLAGKTVRFRAYVKGIRKRELPELNDEFAQDLGDYRTMEELREAVRRSIHGQREQEAQQEAKNQLVEILVDKHVFPAPETFVEQQIRSRTEQSLRTLVAEGVDVSKMKLDWKKIREQQKDRAVREVKAAMLLSKIAERESIHATKDEVDREVDRIARQHREPFAAVRMRLEKEGTLGNIAHNIETAKTLSFLFEHARKTAE